MKHSFDLDNFESFLSDQADRHRMYPSDRVWRNIQQNIHGTDRWPALTFGAILTMATLAVVLTITYPNRNLFHQGISEAHIAKTESAESVKERNSQPIVTNAGLVAKQDLKNISQPAVSSSSDYPVASTTESLDELTRQVPSEMEPVYTDQHEVEVNSLNENGFVAGASQNNNSSERTDLSIQPLLISAMNANGFSGTITNAPKEFNSFAQRNEAIAEKAFIQSSLGYGPVEIEKSASNRNRWSVQIYATPSISYRYLLEDKKYVDDPSTINGPLAPYLTNSVNEFVRHQPKMGIEIGSAVLYKVAENFRLKTGLQLNYRQYGIEAYATNMQPAILTLNRGNRVDSIVRFTNISSQGGYRQLDLSSNTLQLAIPVGFDLRMAQFKNIGFYLAASGQLTYQLGNNSFVLSDDYKNYMKQPDLDRKFNINTAVEAFVSFEAGGVTWQAGPQIRYQMLPGTTDAYPIREHLIDYGLKVGVVKTLK